MRIKSHTLSCGIEGRLASLHHRGHILLHNPFTNSMQYAQDRGLAEGPQSPFMLNMSFFGNKTPRTRGRKVSENVRKWYFLSAGKRGLQHGK